jgi:hypothetical protein
MEQSLFQASVSKYADLKPKSLLLKKKCCLVVEHGGKHDLLRFWAP